MSVIVWLGREVTGNRGLASCLLLWAPTRMLASKLQFRTVGAQQVGVTGEVIGPMPGDAAAALGTQGAAETGDEAQMVAGCDDNGFVRPDRQQPRQILRTIVGDRADGTGKRLVGNG